MLGYTTQIGGKHQISETLWALSLVRRTGNDHAYLVLEGMDEKGERVMQDAHLVVKEGTNNKKAQIVFRNLSLAQLRVVAEGCSSYTWSLPKDRAQAFVALVQEEQKRDINYVLLGNPTLAGGLGRCLATMSSEEWKAASEAKSDGSCMDMLLRDGHNCCSWAIAMVKATELRFTGSWSLVKLVAIDPRREVSGTHDGDKEPSSGEKVRGKCLVM